MKRFILLELLVLFCLPGVFAEDSLTPAQKVFFETKIRPVLIKECYSCHSSQSGNARGGLTLDSRERIAIGGTSGTAILPGNAEESVLYQALTYDGFEMPPSGKLSSDVIEDFRSWIEMGAPDPRVQQVNRVESTITSGDIELAKNAFWAYRDPRHIDPPEVENRSWPISVIDQYILAKLEHNALEPSLDASAHELLRRLTFDLVGLPPTREQMRHFEILWSIDPQNAIGHVVDRLLESSHFGERWGRHWMDVVRYGESTGRAVNMTYAHAWRYRDYIIDSFNQDKPYDRFVQEQLAGDLLPAKSDEEFSSHLVATGFLAVGSKNVNESNRVQFTADLIDEQIDATSRVFLGLSVACARCHDHKFDAIKQEDYYALAGIFQSTNTFFGNPQSELGHFSDATDKQTSTLLILPVDQPSPYARSVTADRVIEIREQMETERQRMIESRRSGTANQANSQRERAAYLKRMAAFSGELASVDDRGHPKSFCMGVQDAQEPRDAKLLVRGEIDQPLETVRRGVPQVLSDDPLNISPGSSGRLELAKWIGSEQNPLTARVMVNRIWMHLIGEGIVRSTEDFGETGNRPTHPELLDYLALRFIESGWSVKSVVREIVTSRVYRLSSAFDARSHTIDPDNELVWRATQRRLDAESIRDAMLCISGELQTKAPEASLVAALGYTRVIGGSVLPRRTPFSAFSMSAQAFTESQGSRSEESFGDMGFRRGRFRSGRNFGRPPGRFSQDDGSKIFDAESAKYRSVYLPLVRDAEPRSLAVFDLANTSVVVGKREVSNTANQALYLLNNPFVQQQSRAFAERVMQEEAALPDQLANAVLLAYGRPAEPEELESLQQFIREQIHPDTTMSLDEVLSLVCQSLFASAEFLYLN